MFKKITLFLLTFVSFFTLTSCTNKLTVKTIIYDSESSFVLPKTAIKEEVLNTASKSVVSVKFKNDSENVHHSAFDSSLSKGVVYKAVKGTLATTYYVLTLNGGIYLSGHSFKTSPLDLSTVSFSFTIGYKSYLFAAKNAYSLDTKTNLLIQTTSANDLFVLSFDVPNDLDIDLTPATFNTTTYNSFSDFTSYDLFAYESYDQANSLTNTLRLGKLATMNTERKIPSLVHATDLTNLQANLTNIKAKVFQLDLVLNINNLGTPIFDKDGNVLGLFVYKDVIQDYKVDEDGTGYILPAENTAYAIYIQYFTDLLEGIVYA